ncbi:hypothetical protein Tco_0300908, partial [Tanacetum coccineum]
EEARGDDILRTVCCSSSEHFGLLTEERLKGLTMIIRDLPMIDIAELVPAAGAPEFTEGAPNVDEGD